MGLLSNNNSWNNNVNNYQAWPTATTNPTTGQTTWTPGTAGTTTNAGQGSANPWVPNGFDISTWNPRARMPFNLPSGQPAQAPQQPSGHKLYAGMNGSPNGSGGFTPAAGSAPPAGPLYGSFVPPPQQATQPNHPYAPVGNPASFGIGQYSTSITPSPIYSPEQTQWAVNSALSNAAQQADPRYAMKQFMSPGMAQDQGKYAAALPSIANALSSGQQQAALIPLQDAFANQQNLLSGQIAQQNEANGLANALAQFNENNIYQQNQMLNPLLQLLLGGMGGMF